VWIDYCKKSYVRTGWWRRNTSLITTVKYSSSCKPARPGTVTKKWNISYHMVFIYTIVCYCIKCIQSYFRPSRSSFLLPHTCSRFKVRWQGAGPKATNCHAANAFSPYTKKRRKEYLTFITILILLHVVVVGGRCFLRWWTFQPPKRRSWSSHQRHRNTAWLLRHAWRTWFSCGTKVGSWISDWLGLKAEGTSRAISVELRQARARDGEPFLYNWGQGVLPKISC